MPLIIVNYVFTLKWQVTKFLNLKYFKSLLLQISAERSTSSSLLLSFHKRFTRFVFNLQASIKKNAFMENNEPRCKCQNVWLCIDIL